MPQAPCRRLRHAGVAVSPLLTRALQPRAWRPAVTYVAIREARVSDCGATDAWRWRGRPRWGDWRSSGRRHGLLGNRDPVREIRPLRVVRPSNGRDASVRRRRAIVCSPHRRQCSTDRDVWLLDTTGCSGARCSRPTADLADVGSAQAAQALGARQSPGCRAGRNERRAASGACASTDKQEVRRRSARGAALRAPRSENASPAGIRVRARWPDGYLYRHLGLYGDLAAWLAALVIGYTPTFFPRTRPPGASPRAADTEHGASPDERQSAGALRKNCRALCRAPGVRAHG